MGKINVFKIVTIGILLLMVACVFTILLSCKYIEADPIEFSLTLYWTATGDDGNMGTATLYDLRYSDNLITDANFLNCEQILIGVPQIAGTAEIAAITFIAESQVEIFFAIKAIDESGNRSPLSNVYSEITTDIIPPAAIIDLRGEF